MGFGGSIGNDNVYMDMPTGTWTRFVVDIAGRSLQITFDGIGGATKAIPTAPPNTTSQRFFFGIRWPSPTDTSDVRIDNVICDVSP